MTEYHRKESSGLFNNVDNWGLNTANGLARLDYDEEAYFRVLRAYSSHIPSFVETVKTAVNGSLDEYRIAVHGIKGSSWAIGAEELGDEAEKLEYAARDEDTAYIRANNGLFIEMAEKFLISLAAFIKSIDSMPGRIKPEREKPEPDLLDKALNASREYDITSLKNVINSLDDFTYRSFPGFTDWLREQADNSDFEKIQVKLEELLSEAAV